MKVEEGSGPASSLRWNCPDIVALLMCGYNNCVVMMIKGSLLALVGIGGWDRNVLKKRNINYINIS